MMTNIRKAALVLLALPLGALAVSASLYDFTVNSIEGKPVALKTYQGRVALVVNTASECGFTPQYEGLQSLYEKYQKRGLVVLGFPCNDFGGQEPGSAGEIKQFCSSKFHVTFPMFEKVTVKVGKDQAPVYRFLSSNGDIPSWNFGKYLVNKQGKLIGFFGSSTRPDDAKLVAAIEAALK
ncbi:MAG: glutathione peroxidase [Vulcanimicrobiota bacterium]